MSKGRPVVRPNHKLRKWLSTSNYGTGAALVAAANALDPPRFEGRLSYQMLTYYVLGTRYVPYDLASWFDKVSNGKVPHSCWYLVRNRLGERYLHLGKQVTKAEARSILVKRRELAKVPF